MKQEIIVAFHIGRGMTSFVGEMKFRELVSLNDTFEVRRDKKGRFISPYLSDCSGNWVSDDSISSDVGRLEFDGAYNTDYCKRVSELLDYEVNIITQSDRYKSIDLILWLEERTGITFDKWI